VVGLTTSMTWQTASTIIFTFWPHIGSSA